jgi:cupin fold WbuC family metalloprotein
MIKIDQYLTGPLIMQAREATRRRKNYNFHRSHDDTLQRLLNAMEPGTYVHPHKHESPDKREAFLVITGTLLVVEFDEIGNITDHIILNRNLGNYGTEIAERTYHTVISLENGSVAYEAKDGPYDPADDKYFASWAPPENSPACADYIASVLAKLNISPVC